MFSPRAASSRDWFRAGFFAALGAALLALLGLTTWKLSAAILEISLPFVLGGLLALLLDPLVHVWQRRGIRRLPATVLAFSAFLFIIVGGISAITPRLTQQASQLSSRANGLVGTVQATASEWLKEHPKVGPFRLPKRLKPITDGLSARASAALSQYTGGIATFFQNMVSAILNLVIALVIAFFLLADLDRLRARLFYLMPDRARGPTHQIASDIGGVFSDYLRGLVIVCGLYGLFTVILLYLMSLSHHALAEYALLVGVMAGVLYAVPYIGSLTTAGVTFLVTFSVATYPHHSGLSFALTAVVLTFLLNQIFDNIITPRVVGGGVGLHPVAAIFALILGGHLFGIWGMLLSVPIAASIQVILFRLFPRLTTPTPTPFLKAQGVPKDEIEAMKVAEGDHPDTPNDPSEVREAIKGH